MTVGKLMEIMEQIKYLRDERIKCDGLTDSEVWELNHLECMQIQEIEYDEE